MSLEKVWKKGVVLAELYRRKLESADQIVTSPELQSAIRDKRPDLGVANPANFLKDIIRRPNANALWPADLCAKRITARQRFGKRRILEFIPFLEGYDVPFPDRFEPSGDTPIFDVQSVSLPSAARRLGRTDENWLAQVVVNLRIVESQLAFKSKLADRLLDITPLQIGMKTQPEIDATYVATIKGDAVGSDEHLFVTCEVKGRGERLLEDQIRFQIHQAFFPTADLTDPPIDAVKPFAIRVMHHSADEPERLVHVVEFETVTRGQYKNLWPPEPPRKNGGRVPKAKKPEDDTPVYDIHLERASDAFYRVRPPVRGLSYK